MFPLNFQQLQAEVRHISDLSIIIITVIKSSLFVASRSIRHFSLSLVTFELTEPRASLLTCLDMCGGGGAILMSVCGRAPDQNAERVSRPWAS